jgi:hypothetical protein
MVSRPQTARTGHVFNDHIGGTGQIFRRMPGKNTCFQVITGPRPGANEDLQRFTFIKTFLLRRRRRVSNEHADY